METRPFGSNTSAVARVHWTAPVSCALSVGTASFLALQFGVSAFAPVAPLYYVMSLLRSEFYWASAWLPLPLTLLALVVGGVALAISLRPPWRKGRRLAIIGVGLPGLILVLYGALIIYLAFFWHPHFV